MFKGKFKEGEKAEPATWKTRLRCALNKSPDFEEVTDRSQLDISEPYKVYRIVPEEEQKREFGVEIFHKNVLYIYICMRFLKEKRVERDREGNVAWDCWFESPCFATTGILPTWLVSKLVKGVSSLPMHEV